MNWLNNGVKDCDKAKKVITLNRFPSLFRLRLSHLYVRECYGNLFRLCGEHDIVGITGNPGIGKTVFGIYLIFKLIMAKKTLVYQRGNFLYWISGEIFHEVNSVTSVDCYILDALNSQEMLSPHVTAKQTVFIYSPASKSKHWELNKGRILHMPIWKRTEIDILNGQHKLEKENLDERFTIFGGIPRHVFASDDGVLGEIRRMKHSINSPDILSLSNLDDIKISHLIFHRYTVTMTGFIFMVATHYVEELLAISLQQIKQLNIHNFLESSVGVSGFSILRGQIFEQFAHSYSKRRCYKYDEPANIFKFTIEPKQYMKFTMIEEAVDERLYGVPHTLNFHYICH